MCNRVDLKLKTIPKMFKMASSSDLFLLFKLTQNVTKKRQNLTQRFTEEAHLYQDLQLAQQQDIRDVIR